MKTIMSKVLTVLMVVMMAGVAYAGSNVEKPTLETLDADKNGFISKEEAATSDSVAKLFDEADANKDKQLDKSEFVTIASKLGK